MPENISEKNKNIQRDITFVTVIDTRLDMRGWAKRKYDNLWGGEKAEWIIFDRSEEPDEELPALLSGAGENHSRGGADGKSGINLQANADDETDEESEINSEENADEDEDYESRTERERERERELLEAAEYEAAVRYAAEAGVKYHKVPSDTSSAKCYNSAAETADTPYICYTNGYVTYEGSVVPEFYRAREMYPDAPLFSVDYKEKFKEADYDEERSADIEQNDLDTVSTIRIFLPSYFIRRDLTEGLRFSDVCEEESGTAYLLGIFKRQKEFIFLKGIRCYYSRILNRRSDRFYGCKNKDFYINSLEGIYLPILHSYREEADGAIPMWMRKAVYYQIYFKYYANLNLRNKYLLDKEETKKFLELTKEILQLVDDDIIMDNTKPEQYAPPFILRNLFLGIKYDFDKEKLSRSFYIEDGGLFIRQCGCRYDLSAHQNLKVRAFNIRERRLCIDMRYFTHLLYKYNPQAIYATLNGVRYDPVPTGVYALDKVFGESIEKSYTFLMEFPIDEMKREGARIEFWLQPGDEKVRMPLFFHRAASKLNNRCPHTYWMIDKTHMLCCEDDGLLLCEADERTVRRREKLYLKEAVSCIRETQGSKKKRKYYIREVKRSRRAYFREKKKADGRRIWIFFDKLYKAGDNGEYAFRYANGIDDGIECYYVINEDAPDCIRLKEEFGDRILMFNSSRCKLYALLAETVVATHPDIIEFFGYDPKQTEFMRDLFNPNLVCIAHGITIQKNADYQNRLFDNTMFYTASSKYEVEHLLHPIYGYRPDELALTGMARFDGLKSNDKRQILITPTWRRNLVGRGARNSTRRYSKAFKETNYYKIYNSLINDERVIKCAKRCGYRVIFLLHPAMSAQIDDYDQNGYVDIIPASGDMSYEKILTESSLMVTDYSGIHFDFGYMRKPVIYYQPKEVPMRFEEGGMKFATMGFGPVCTEYDEAVRMICKYMEDDCKIQPEYKRRADDFFAFDDFDNSRRIYEAVRDWVDEKKRDEI